MLPQSPAPRGGGPGRAGGGAGCRQPRRGQRSRGAEPGSGARSGGGERRSRGGGGERRVRPPPAGAAPRCRRRAAGPSLPSFAPAGPRRSSKASPVIPWRGDSAERGGCSPLSTEMAHPIRNPPKLVASIKSPGGKRDGLSVGLVSENPSGLG